MTFPEYIPATGPCVLADGVPFVPGMPVYFALPLGDWQLYQADTSQWEPRRAFRMGKLCEGWTPEDDEWVFYHVQGAMIGAAAMFISSPRGVVPEEMV